MRLLWDPSWGYEIQAIFSQIRLTKRNLNRLTESIPKAPVIVATILGISLSDLWEGLEAGTITSAMLCDATVPPRREEPALQRKGSDYVEEWDPGFDPRSTLIKDL